MELHSRETTIQLAIGKSTYCATECSHGLTIWLSDTLFLGPLLRAGCDPKRVMNRYSFPMEL